MESQIEEQYSCGTDVKDFIGCWTRILSSLQKQWRVPTTQFGWNVGGWDCLGASPLSRILYLEFQQQQQQQMYAYCSHQFCSNLRSRIYQMDLLGNGDGEQGTIKRNDLKSINRLGTCYCGAILLSSRKMWRSPIKSQIPLINFGGFYFWNSFGCKNRNCEQETSYRKIFSVRKRIISQITTETTSVFLSAIVAPFEKRTRNQIGSLRIQSNTHGLLTQSKKNTATTAL